MFNKFAKLLFTLTAGAPIVFTYAWVAFYEEKSDIVFSVLMLLMVAVLVLLCLLLVWVAKVKYEVQSFEVVSVEAADRENVGFLLLYLFPLFTSSFETLQWQVGVPALIVFSIVVSTGYNYHFNPLLGMLGWHFYKVNTPEGVTYILVTKKEIRRAKKGLKVVQLTEYIVLDKE